jgi:diguanylate cyclase (GGDEF)-like protein
LLSLALVNLFASLAFPLFRSHEAGLLIFVDMLAPLLTALACFHRSLTDSVETRRTWTLIAAGLVLGALGPIRFLHSGGTLDATRILTQTGNFFLFIEGIPIMLALSCASEDDGLRSFLWPDGLIAAIVIALAYFELFSVTPALSHLEPVTVADFSNVYAIQNGILACACTVRVILSSPGERRKIYFALSAFLWINAIDCAIFSHSPFVSAAPAPVLNVLWEAPFLLLLALLAFWPRAGHLIETEMAGVSTAAFVIDNLSPLSLSIGVIILASQIKKEYVVLQIFSITTAVMLFGIRTAMRQSSYVQGHLQVVHSQQALIEANAQLTREATRDGLTGAYNRRYFDQMLNEEWKRAIRAQQPLSLIIVDVDHFKSLNDRYGHPTGDAVLRAIVRTLTTVLRRPSDLLARYGGEEFAIILPGADLRGAMLVGEHIRTAVEYRQIPNDQPDSARVVTVSVGVGSEQPKVGSTPQGLLDKVDEALYRAKAEGRNQVCSYSITNRKDSA